jgi:hypothetical protein
MKARRTARDDGKSRRSPTFRSETTKGPTNLKVLEMNHEGTTDTKDGHDGRDDWGAEPTKGKLLVGELGWP